MDSDSIFQLTRRSFVAAFAAWAAAARAQDEGKGCAVILLHAKSSGPQSLAALAKKMQPACAGRAVEMPWSSRRAADKAGGDALREIAAQAKALRYQGYKRIVVLGQGLGANAAFAYAAKGDVDAVVALGGDGAAAPASFAALPALAPQIAQHVPVLWLVGSNDPLRERGEDFAFAKAPPHPASKFQLLKSDLGNAPEAAAGPIQEWIKALD
ncbi:MAG: dienelactone hydrolase family protein [Ramlibacter sp.]|nr:dienelactone hydrolase family protein [Ramlibacter sp.]